MAEAKATKKETKTRRPRKKNPQALRPIEYLFSQIYDVNSNNILGYDAELVINDKKLGAIPYDRVASVASRSNLAVRLGKWQIEEVCELIKRQNSYGKHIHRIFITLSAKFLSKADFYEQFLKIVDKYEIPHKRFGIQINEAELVAGNTQLYDNIMKLREGGAKVAITDFGAESTSLRQLSTMTVDYVKLNTSFTADIAENERTENITEGIVDLCGKLGVMVIADGIDTKEQLNIMKRMRCFLVEGKYFSSPERENSAII
ncbi:MAG: EAL domain-containing protein [Ruminococcaceae bacterium]|nr:EAL domain-containing protein [Oscillospiraceae bacterium]